MIDVDQDHRELRELEEGWGETQGRVVDFLLKRWKPLNIKFIQGFFFRILDFFWIFWLYPIDYMNTNTILGVDWTSQKTM